MKNLGSRFFVNKKSSSRIFNFKFNVVDLNFWKKDDDNSQDQSDQMESEYYSEDQNLSGEATEEVREARIETNYAEPADPEKAKFYNNISRWCLYASVFLMPLFFLPFTTNVLEINKLMLLLVMASIGMVAWLLGVVSSGYLAWRNNPIDKGLLILLGAFITSAIFSIDSFRSIFNFSNSVSNTLVSISALTIFYFLIVNNAEDRGRVIRSLAMLSLVFTLLYGLLQIFGLHIIWLSFAKSKAFNTVGSLNALGILAAVSLPLFSKSRVDLRWLRNLYLEKIGIFIALFLLFILNWWVLWTVAISGMVAVVILDNLTGGRFKVNKFILPMTVVVLGVFMMVVKLNLNQLKTDLPVEVAPSFSLSKDVVVSVLNESFIFGYGLENYSIAFDRYGAGRIANSTLFDTRFYDAVSEMLTLIVHGGLVMVVGLLAVLLSVILMFWRFNKHTVKSQDRDELNEDVGILASFGAVLATMFLYPFNLTIMFIFYLFMALSVLVVYGSNKKEFNIEERVSLSLGSSLGFIGGLILALVGIYYGATIYIGDLKYAQAVSESDNDKSAGLLIEAINWNNKDDRYYRSASQKAIELLANELKQKASPERDARMQNYVTTSVNLAKRAAEVAPREALNWANLGFVYQNLLIIVDGVDKLSEDAYMKAAELRPGDPTFTYRIGMLYLSKFDRYNDLVTAKRVSPSAVFEDARASLGKAEEYLKKTTELSNNFGLAVYSLGLVYERKGELAEAIAQLEKVAPANSNLPSLAFELGLLYYRAGRKDDALNALQRAVLLASDYANARWYLALIYEERSDLDAAIDQLEKILNVEINKDHPVVLGKLKELQAGKVKIPPGNVLDQAPIR